MIKKIVNKYFVYYKKLVLYYNAFLHKKEPKVFCISMQRSGTSSVGKFLDNFGFRCVGWSEDKSNHWSEFWYNENYDAIFSSIAFKGANAYEDSPWFYPNFYKMLFNRFPNAKFIIFIRDPDAWFKSMMNHSNGDIIGSSKIHCKLYQRELEYFELLNSPEFDKHKENLPYSKKTMKLINHAEHYKAIYQSHTLEVQDFFAEVSPSSLYMGNLDDPLKWQKLGEFLNINVPKEYDCHRNKSSNLPHYQKL